MSTRTRFLAIAIALLASAAPSFAQDMQSRPDDATPCAAPACERDGVERPSGQAERTLPAEVVSIDESAGRVVLNTELGVVTVPATPAIIGQLTVGDVVMLRVVPDADDSPATSPPTEDDAGAARRL
jgi:hypothetical protein